MKEKSNKKQDNKIYPVLALRNTVLFPQQIIPIYIGRKHSLDLINKIDKHDDKHIVAIAQKEGSIENPKSKDLYNVGTLVKVMRIFDMPDNSRSAIVQGIGRVKINKFFKKESYHTATVEKIIEPVVPKNSDIDGKISNLVNLFNQLIDLAPYLSEEQANTLSTIVEPGKIADRAVSFLNIQINEKQNILECVDISKRIDKVVSLISKEIQRIELGQKIQSDVQDEITKSQREYYLREQLKAIQKELGEDDPGLEFQELDEKIQKAQMPKNVKKIAYKELNRMKKIPSHSPEYTVSRTYLDWLVVLPWNNESKDNANIVNAKKVLDTGHYGLSKIKDRIIEHLAVRNLKKERSKKGDILKSPILCFAGPPGTGKTSIGKSIADSMGRKFIRISLGGVRDEAEIRGHRRTYIGALPGRIISSLKKASTKNPIFMLDEIDKLGTDFRGDPSSALLEVLDPEQNFSFNDHYLEVDFDLSNVMFITTANQIDRIPAPLLDRMEVLEFSGYIVEEKIGIAKDYLIPKQVKEHGLLSKEIFFNKQAIKLIIESYTREAGVRNLERQIANLCRKAAKDISMKNLKKIKITPLKVQEYLGPIVFHSEIAERCKKPGVAIGLAWTAFGGDILFIETSKMPGKGNLKLTGKLGDVMKESAEAAFSYIRSNAEKLDIDLSFYNKYDIHIHVPAGAIPKDGPSAGITMVVAMVSLLKNKKIKSKLGMTGEISLRGNVLPIGGLREKVTAAHRAGIKSIIAPYNNKKDLEDIPANILKNLKITFVKEVDEVIKLSF
ncbi:MAG: endopeptidase La [Candidatus Marinimicrobia bacterium]|nr:endopeptidase La [Candidatus Neomarinimicrobiota bacterium]|tara:strand:+ start:4086 stop:6434 length:2349 start_codon:yes stop_codon:yes gene_type:complete